MKNVYHDQKYEQLPTTPSLEVIMYAAQIQEKVRANLRFEPDSSIDDIEQTGKTNCVGYTLKGSEQLEQADIQHYVGFINGHATLLVPTSQDIWLLDMLSPELNQPLRNVLTLYGQASENRSMARLNSVQLLQQTDLDWESGFDKHPWLRAMQVCTQISGRDSDYDRTERSYSLIASLFKPEFGRNLIYQYAKFNEAYDACNLLAASNAITNMAGYYPDIDMRGDSAKKVKSVVRRLAIAGQFSEADAVTDAFFSSFSVSQDSRVGEYKADCLRYIAQHSGQKTLAKRALELYQSAKKNPNSFNKSISAKIEICNTLAI
ncbi:MAG: hypothetical protein ACR2FM_05430 [Candidatus Saccharimonadales bacterium]